MHLIVSAKENNVSDVLGNFKKFTSKKLVAAIQNNTSESRKEWMIKLFKETGELNSSPDSYRDGIRIMNPRLFTRLNLQHRKLEYIHNNPVDAGIVEKAGEYIYSSARDYYYGKQCGLIEIEFLF